ncbi:MAG: type II secretion system GspH family protein [Holophagales bacterium]|nr:type II secretion system GspH family protein [Holophagales bacterium]
MKSNQVSRAFTLLELLIVVVIMMLLAAVLIPNLLDALQKAKQKQTMAQMKIIGDAFMSWQIDQAGAASAGAGATYSTESYTRLTGDELAEVLTPRYLQAVQNDDNWGGAFRYLVSSCCSVETSPTRLSCTSQCPETFMIVSCGRDRECSDSSYTAGVFAPWDHDQDIVWLDGYFVRRPGSAEEVRDLESADDD